MERSGGASCKQHSAIAQQVSGEERSWDDHVGHHRKLIGIGTINLRRIARVTVSGGGRGCISAGHQHLAVREQYGLMVAPHKTHERV